MPNRVQINFIKEALDNLESLNEFENNFILNISNYPDTRELSIAQNRVLNSIHDKLVSLNLA